MKRNTKKLALSSVTVRPLGADQLLDVMGGRRVNDPSWSCNDTCGSCLCAQDPGTVVSCAGQGC